MQGCVHTHIDEGPRAMAPNRVPLKLYRDLIHTGYLTNEKTKRKKDIVVGGRTLLEERAAVAVPASARARGR